MKTASFSFVAKFPAKKVRDCFTNPAFAKLHSASKFFAKPGILKADKNLIIRTVSNGADKTALPMVAVITFAEADEGKATEVEAVIANVPDAKVADLKALGKIINADISTFLTPKPKAVKEPAKKGPKAGAKKAAAKKPAKEAKPAAEKKAAAKKPVAAKKPAAAKKTAAPKKAATAKKPAAKKAAKPVETAPAAPAAKE
jgi:hypothetical protein